MANSDVLSPYQHYMLSENLPTFRNGACRMGVKGVFIHVGGARCTSVKTPMYDGGDVAAVRLPRKFDADENPFCHGSRFGTGNMYDGYRA